MSSLIGPSACARKPRKLETSHDRRRLRRVEKFSRAVIGREEVPAAAHTAAPYGVPLKSFFRFSEIGLELQGSDVSYHTGTVPVFFSGPSRKIQGQANLSGALIGR